MARRDCLGARLRNKGLTGRECGFPQEIVMKLQGIFVSVATPFNHRGEIWQTKVEHNVAKWNRTSVAGYVVCGAAGEGASLSQEEKIRMWEWVAKYADPEKVLIAAADTPEETAAAMGLGYKGAASDPDFVAMNAPGGLCGLDSGFASSLAAKGVGIISTIANAAPYAMISIWEAHRTRDTEAAADWQNRIAKAVELIHGSNGIAALKYAMDLNGYYGGPPRLPGTVLTPGEKSEVERAFAGIKG
jgi:dihydrodipicolinate synthase/N-acetylneuraminate lyase